MLTLLGDVFVLGFVAIGVPFIAGSMVAHGTSMALEHFRGCEIIGGSAARPLAKAAASGVKAGAAAVYRQFSSSNQRTTLDF